MNDGLELNPIRMLWDVFYGMASSVTGTVGLTPLQVLAGFGVLLLVVIGAQLALALSGKSSWSLEDLREQRQQALYEAATERERRS